MEGNGLRINEYNVLELSGCTKKEQDNSHTGQNQSCGRPETENCRALLIRHHVRYVPEYYRDADKSLARPTSRCILFDVENIWFDASLVIYI